MDANYTCEQCGRGAMLCVSDWGYIAALCEGCFKERKNYLRLPQCEPQREAIGRTAPASAAA